MIISIPTTHDVNDDKVPAGSEGALREYRAMPDSTSVVTRMQHNISEFVKHFGSINIELYEVIYATYGTLSV